MRHFFENFFDCIKGSPFIFLIFWKIIDNWKSQMVPHFRFFGTMRLFKIVIFHLTLGFLNTYPPIFFFNTIRNLNVISGVKRYIRIFDVISEVYSVSLRRRRRFENKCSHLSQPLYPNFWSVFPARKASFGWNFSVSFSWKNARSIVWKFCFFWALDIAPTLAVLGLFTFQKFSWKY